MFVVIISTTVAAAIFGKVALRVFRCSVMNI
jgi:hypothetical protein